MDYNYYYYPSSWPVRPLRLGHKTSRLALRPLWLPLTPRTGPQTSLAAHKTPRAGAHSSSWPSDPPTGPWNAPTSSQTPVVMILIKIMLAYAIAAVIQAVMSVVSGHQLLFRDKKEIHKCIFIQFHIFLSYSKIIQECIFHEISALSWCRSYHH